LQLARNKEELREIGYRIAEFSFFSEENLNILRRLYQERYYKVLEK
ncbi:MAG TPA: hypothetical protein GXZ20_03585, partial [Halanaerobiaceae bacterium]|nr:hypothetical protein [Halanaerobiaceae bacterium]